MTNLVTQENLELLRNAVAAKVRYWDALRKLESAIAPGGEEFSDAANDKVIDELSSLAAGLTSADNLSLVTMDALQRVVTFAQE